MQDRSIRHRGGVAAICFLASVVGGTAGCDGSGGAGQATTDGGVTDGGSRDGKGSIFKQDAAQMPRTDARAVITEAPISPMMAKLPLKGKVTLLGSGISSCTHQTPSPGDRWCAVSRASELGREQLWVINVTAASAGTPVECTGTDPNCILLTDNLWTGTPTVGPTYPYAHAFDGDTLIFHANAKSAATELYQGPIYSWRPGWPAPRQISTDKGVLCQAHLQGLAAWCIDNIEPDDTKELEFDLLAGPLPATPNAKLPRIDRIHPTRFNDVSKWDVGFSRDGSQFCYSTGRTADDGENLWCFATANLPANAVAVGTRNTTPMVADAANWQISRDSQKLYYLKDFNYSEAGNPDGVLTMVDYPTAANPVALAESVGGYVLLSDGTNTDKGVAILTEVAQKRGAFRFIRDRNAPANVVTIASTVASASISQDLRYTYFSKKIDAQTNLRDAYVARNNEATAVKVAPTCTLQSKTTTDSWGSPFLAKSGLVFWVDDVDSNVFSGKGMVANPADCSNKVQFAKDLDFWFTVNDEGIIYSDDLDIDVVSLRYLRTTDGKTWPTGGAGLPLQKQASRVYGMSLPKYDMLIVEMNQGFPSDGLYYAKLPFGSPIVTPADAGVADAGTADASVDAM
jgi:hypothetical protein